MIISMIPTYQKEINKNKTKRYESKGLGDTVEKITTATGVKKIISLASGKTGKPCGGCNKRKEILNKIFPYKK